MHELYVPSDKSMCMFYMVVGCCSLRQKFMKDKKNFLYNIYNNRHLQLYIDI
jgi:hypothetical protein